MTAQVFSTSVPYAIGTVVLYDNVFYLFTVFHQPGPWNTTHVVALTAEEAADVTGFNSLPDYNFSRPLGTPRYTITYLPNNDAIDFGESFVRDTHVYLAGESATILTYTHTHYSEDGAWLYTFIGWSLANNLGSTVSYTSGTIAMPAHNLVLYAQWSKESTLELSSVNHVSVKLVHRTHISKLIIPEYLGGVRIKEIATNGFQNATISEVVIPANIIKINSSAFNGWTGSRLRFIDADITAKYPSLTLAAGCFVNTPNLVSLLLPYRWQGCSGIGSTLIPIRLFAAEPNKAAPVVFYIRNTKEFMVASISTGTGLFGNGISDSTIEPRLFEEDNTNILYTRTVYWGYND